MHRLLAVVTLALSLPALAEDKEFHCIKNGKEVRRHKGSCEKEGGRWEKRGTAAKAEEASPKPEAPAAETPKEAAPKAP
jgi:hypothetical protein